ncbi:MAG: 50S ribosomal protein L9 [Syntrophales bacterium]|nr:50S ribosomal protein L9 [Syntrophales bacterium]MDY0044848.1 50S ribosomal protein L9 [Syntrophales bacterium]
MKIILKQDIESLGKMGTIIKVSDGYARNYLIPKDLAVEANTRNIKAMEHEKRIISEKAEKEKGKAQATAEMLDRVVITLSRKVGEQDKLFGSVTSRDIEEALQDQGVVIDRKNIVLDEPIKSVGEFKVKVKLYSGVTGSIKVNVIGEK